MNISIYFNEILYRINVHLPIEDNLLRDAFYEVLSNPDEISRDVQLASLLRSLMPIATQSNIAALLEVAQQLDHLDEKKIPLSLSTGKKVIGVAGSGKKGFKTINISTPSSLVAATAGAYIAKNVSHSTSSYLGSSDFLTYLGANLQIPLDEMMSILVETGFGAFSIENLAPKFDHVYGGRFSAPHILSFGLAAMLSPFKYDRILYGFSHPNTDLSARVLNQMGIQTGLVVASSYDTIHYIDELCAVGKSYVSEFKANTILKQNDIFDARQELSLPAYDIAQIEQRKTYEAHVHDILTVLRGRGDKAQEDTIALNAGAMLYLSDIADTIERGYFIAKSVIRDGAAFTKLMNFVKQTGGKIERMYTTQKAHNYESYHLNGVKAT